MEVVGVTLARLRKERDEWQAEATRLRGERDACRSTLNEQVKLLAEQTRLVAEQRDLAESYRAKAKKCLLEAAKHKNPNAAPPAPGAAAAVVLNVPGGPALSIGGRAKYHQDLPQPYLRFYPHPLPYFRRHEINKD